MLVSGGADKTILVWDVRTAKPINAILAHSSEIIALDWSYDSSTIVSGSTDGYWYFGWGLCNFLKNLKAVYGIFMMENAQLLCFLRIVLLCTESDNFINHNFFRSSVRLSDNSQYLLLSALENNLSLWSIKTGKNVIDYKGTTD